MGARAELREGHCVIEMPFSNPVSQQHEFSVAGRKVIDTRVDRILVGAIHGSSLTTVIEAGGNLNRSSDACADMDRAIGIKVGQRQPDRTILRLRRDAIDWITFTICAMLAMRSRSACRAKMLRFSAATMASRCEPCEISL